MGEYLLWAQPLGAVALEEKAFSQEASGRNHQRLDYKPRKVVMKEKSLLIAALRTTLHFPPSLLPDFH